MKYTYFPTDQRDIYPLKTKNFIFPGLDGSKLCYTEGDETSIRVSYFFGAFGGIITRLFAELSGFGGVSG